MHYVIQTGILFSGENQPLMRIKGAFSGQEKTISRPDGTIVMWTMIRSIQPNSVYAADVHNHEYVLLNEAETAVATAKPDYAAESDASATEWPVCRLPRVDHASVTLRGQEYRLNFQNSQNYTMTDSGGAVCVQIYHRGLVGGWNVEADEAFLPEELCGIFAFCRYLELENEPMI